MRESERCGKMPAGWWYNRGRVLMEWGGYHHEKVGERMIELGMPVTRKCWEGVGLGGSGGMVEHEPWIGR